jgi:hypothetical protein
VAVDTVIELGYCVSNKMYLIRGMIKNAPSVVEEVQHRRLVIESTIPIPTNNAVRYIIIIGNNYRLSASDSKLINCDKHKCKQIIWLKIRTW